VVDAATDYERLMYQLPLVGVAFNRDNETVFSYIQLVVLQTPAETWISMPLQAEMAAQP
jgi:hypothetical protein